MKFSNEEKIQILRDLVAIQSVNDHEIKVCNYLENLFKKYGIEVTIQSITETRANLIAEIGKGLPIIAVSGHMDVVSEGDHSKWTNPPFELTERNGKLYGRGAADMKSGLAAIVIAMIELHTENEFTNGTIRLLATSGEETEQGGSHLLQVAHYMDDVNALLIAEPCEQQVIHGHKGSMNFKVQSNGSSAHSSAPILGNNAITPLLKFVLTLEEAFNEEIKNISFNHFNYDGISEMIVNQVHLPYSSKKLNEILSRPLLTNTVIHGGNQVNSIPEAAYALFNARTVLEFDNERMLSFMSVSLKTFNETNGTNLTLETTLNLHPVVATNDNLFVKTAQQLAEKHFNKKIPIAPTLGVTDASNLIKDKSIPFVMIGPGDGETAHQTDESVSIESYLSFVDYYKLLLMNYAPKI